MIQNFINGNLKDAKKQAKRFSELRIFTALRENYGFSEKKALLTAHYLKTGEGFQAACDAQ